MTHTAIDAPEAQESAWWDDTDYRSEEVQPLWSMTIEAPEQFSHPCGFVRLRERHRVKAVSRPIV